MSEQNKIDEIKEDVNPVADEMWALDAFDVIVDQDGSIIAEVFDKDAAQLLGKANKHITYLLAEIERKDEALNKAITRWESATPEDDFEDLMHEVIDTLRAAL